MIKYILALFLFFFPIMVFSAENIKELDEEVNPATSEYKESAEDAKFQDDSENCYENAENQFKKQPGAKKLDEDAKSDRLEEIFSECMALKGHNMNEDSVESDAVKE